MPQVDITLTGEVAGPAWDQVRTVRYDSAMKPLGYGMVGAVYRTDEADDRRQYVVKVPHDEAGQAEFEAEYTILRDLWRKLGDPVPVPPVAWGQRADTGGRVLVMPCYEHLLSDTIQDLLRERDWLAAERTAVQAARDYARVMEAVRELKQSCTDRKVKDFFLDSRGQLIIIDWNVLNPDTPDFRAAELQVFGQLWHQLLLQRIGSPPFKPFSDLLWLPRERTDAPGGFPSVGLRLILAAAVHPDISRRFVQDGHPSHTPLRGVLDEWLKVLFSPNNTDLQHWFPGEYEAVQADLDWRLAGYPADRKADRDRLMNQFIVSGFAGDTHSQAIVGRLESGNLEGADGYVQEQLQAQIDFVTRQKLERWGVVLQTLGAARDAFGSGSRADVLMRDLRADLLDVMETLVDDPVGDGPGVLDAAGNRLDDITSRLQTDLGERPLRQNLSTPLAQLMAEIALRHRAILYRNVDWNLRERYTAWREAQMYLSRLPYQPFPDDLAQNSLVRQMFPDSLVVNDLVEALARKDTVYLNDVYYLTLALSSGADHGWLRAALEPVGDALRFLRLDDEGKTATMPVDFVVPQALLLCNGLTESDEWRDHAGVLVDQLKDVARESVKRTHQDIQRAVDAKQIAAVRDVKPTVDGLAAVADRLPEVVGPDSELLQEIDQLLGEYGELYQLFAAWRNLARQHGVENPDRHAILEQPLGIFRKIVDLIRQSQERGWDMRDILGDDEQAIQSLVERLEQFARQIAERHEASLAQQKTYENKLDARLGEFDQTVHDFQGQLNTRATLADLGGVRRDVDNLHKIDLPSLTKRVDDIGTDLHNLPNNVASLRDLQALDMRIAEIRQQVNDLERSLKTTSPELVGLAAFREQRQRLDDAESQVIREIVGRIGGVEVKNDEARLELLQELHDIARTCSWAVFGQVFGDWDTAFQAHARTLKGYKPAKSDSADPSGFGAELSRLAEDNKGDFPIIHYWYESVCKKYQSAQPATATQSTEETQTSKHKFDQSHGSSR